MDEARKQLLAALSDMYATFQEDGHDAETIRDLIDEEVSACLDKIDDGEHVSVAPRF